MGKRNPLGPGIRKIGSRYYWCDTRHSASGKRSSIPLGADLSTAQERLHAFRTAQRFIASRSAKTMAANLLHSTRVNARTRGIEHSLTRENILQMLEATAGICSVTGVPLVFDRFKGRHPWTPSVDRKDAKRGYTLENCRIVCTAANLAMNIWGEFVLETIVRYAKSRERNSEIAKFSTVSA
jgi:hypothetical protein